MYMCLKLPGGNHYVLFHVVTDEKQNKKCLKSKIQKKKKVFKDRIDITQVCLCATEMVMRRQVDDWPCYTKAQIKTSLNV